MRYQHLLKYSLAALLAFSLPACSDDSSLDVNPENNDEPKDPDDPQIPDDPEIPYDPELPVEEPEEGWHSILVPAMATDVEVANASNVRLQVMLVSLQSEDAGEGIVGEDVKWGIETGVSSVKLTTGKTTTGEGGLTNINVKATEIPGNAVVVASNAASPKAVKFKIKVLEKPTGKLTAEASYNGPAPDEYYSIRIYDGDAVECSSVDLENGSIPDINTDTQAEPLFPAVDDKYASFDKLSTDMRYTLIAYAYSEAGAPVAAGCLDSGTKVRPNETTKVSIPMQTIDLDPVTHYDIRSYFDLGDVVSALGQIGKYIGMVGDFAGNPGGFVYEQVFGLVKNYVSTLGGTIADWILKTFGLDTKVKNYINELIASNQTACKVGLFACQFRSIIRTMEFMGNLDIQREGSVELSGSDSYNGLAVYWRMNCAGSSDPECGRYPISTTSINTGTDINLLEGTWRGSVSNGYDKISIESHLLFLKYGKIIVTLLNDFLIPRLTKDQCKSRNDQYCKAHPDEIKCLPMKCAIDYWIDADSIAQWLSDTLTMKVLGLWQVTVDFEKARGWVDTAVNSIYNVLNFGSAYLEMQNAGSDIEISGTAKFVDTNADNVVDDITGGTWTGSMTITTQSKDDNGSATTITRTTGVRGIWSAYNAKNVEEDGEMYCTHENTSDKENRKCDYPVIDIDSLTSSGMCSTFAKCAN
ncbi:MAG: hypothetical protein IJU23_04330 [Proteobacteria bacterium]|nr:hypothetical protein [Pseudomonadota bacterium]